MSQELDILELDRASVGKSRRSLIERPRVRGHRKTMQTAYNDIYRHRQRKHGIPTRREVAESILQAVIKESTGPSPGPGREMLRVAGRLLQSIRNPDGSPRYARAGILKRWTNLVEEFAVETR
jgi:hypothetical protein